MKTVKNLPDRAIVFVKCNDEVQKGSCVVFLNGHMIYAGSLLMCPDVRDGMEILVNPLDHLGTIECVIASSESKN